MGFPGGASGKECPCQFRRHRRLGFNPWVGKISWRRWWRPLQHSFPGNPMDRGAWWATAHGITKSWTRVSSSAPNCIHVSPTLPIPPALFSLPGSQGDSDSDPDDPIPEECPQECTSLCLADHAMSTLEPDVTGESSDGDLVFTYSSVPNASWILCIILILKFLLK